MKNIIKNSLILCLGHQRYWKLDLWLKAIRIYVNRFFFAKNKININSKIQEQGANHIQLDVENAQIFFGYYDHSPISNNGKICLALKIDSPQKVTVFNKAKYSSKKAEVGYFDMCDPSLGFQRIGETSTWCWQQGARLRWFPEGEGLVIYNHQTDKGYGAVIQDLSGREIKRLSMPIYDLRNDGVLALTLNFARLHRMRPGYGYRNLPDATEGDFCPEDDGVWLYDINKSESRLLFSLQMLSGYGPEPSMKEAEHYINHLSWNPSGEIFLFFHIWVNKGKRHTRLFTSSSSGNDLKILVSDSASHFCWMSDHEIVVVTTTEGRLSYKQFDIRSGKECSLETWTPHEDGHPSRFSDRYIITDTYPDKYGQQYLFLCDSEKQKITTLADVYSTPLSAGEVRCDLHPRVIPGSSDVCFDSVFSGRRTVNILNFSAVL